MSNTTPPNLGNIIESASIRKIVYAVYVIVAVIVGGLVAYFLGVGQPLPTPVLGAQGVIAYLGIVTAGLAIANTPATLGKHEAVARGTVSDEQRARRAIALGVHPDEL